MVSTKALSLSFSLFFGSFVPLSVCSGCSWEALARAAGNAGAQIDLALVRKTTNGLTGIHTTRDLSVDEAVLYVPQDMFIFGDARFAKLAIKAMHDEEVAEGPETAALAASLIMMQRRPSRELADSWLKCLPSSDSVDLWSAALFTDMQQDALSVCAAQNLTVAQRWAAKAVSRMKIKGMPVSSTDAQWAVHIATSRGVGIFRSEHSRRETVLVPVLDFVNHGGGANMELDCQEGPNPPGCYLVTQRAVPAGGELRFSYNSEHWSDLVFLTNFGFAPSGNPYALKRQVRPPIHDHAVHQALIKYDCPTHVFNGFVQFHKTAALGIVPKEVDCLRLLSYRDNGVSIELSDVNTQGRHKLDERFYKWLQTMCQKTLQAATTSANESLASLRESDIRSMQLASVLDEEIQALQQCVDGSATQGFASTSMHQSEL